MHEGGLPAVSPAESAVHHMDSTVWPHGGGWHRLRRSCWGTRRRNDDGSYRRGADDFYCGIRSSWVNKQIKKRRHVKHRKYGNQLYSSSTVLYLYRTTQKSRTVQTVLVLMQYVQ